LKPTTPKAAPEKTTETSTKPQTLTTPQIHASNSASTATATQEQGRSLRNSGEGAKSKMLGRSTSLALPSGVKPSAPESKAASIYQKPGDANAVPKGEPTKVNVTEIDR